MLDNDSKKKKLAMIILKAVAIISSVYGLIRTYNGAYSFTMFTNLSNVAISTILAVFMVLDIMELATDGKKGRKTQRLYIIKYMLTIAISLTFLIYMFILAPTNEEGIWHSYFSNGAGSFCVHFIAPLLAIADYFFYEYESNKKHAFYAIIPPLCYVIFVIFLGQVFDYRWYGGMWAPYNFINYGAPTGWFGFDLSLLGEESLGIGVAYMIIVLVIIFYGIGRLALFVKDRKTAKS